MEWKPNGRPRPLKDALCLSEWSRCVPESHSGSPLSFDHEKLYVTRHGTLPFGFLLRTSAIQTSLIALGLSSGDQ